MPRNPSLALGLACLWALSHIGGPGPGLAQAPAIGPGECKAHCGSGRPAKPPPTYRPYKRGPRQPTQREILQKQQAGVDRFNGEGIKAYKRGDYANAVRFFQQALRYDPNNPNIKHNLYRARQRLAAKGQPRKPAVSANRALQEAFSARDHALSAAKAAKRRQYRKAKTESQKPFDTPGKRSSLPARHSVNAAGAAGAWRLGRPARVPAKFKNNPRIKAMGQKRAKLLRQYLQSQKELDQVRRQKAAHPEKRATLEVKEAKIKQKASNTRAQINHTDVVMESYVFNLEREDKLKKAGAK